VDFREQNCGSDPSIAASIPERIDDSFGGVDDDGDTEIDETLPSESAEFDCDGDGFVGTVEDHVYGSDTQGDQSPCGTNNTPPTVPPGPIGWPADLREEHTVLIV
jgi:hypothetical protein